MADIDAGGTLAAAVRGDRQAWTAIVDRYSDLVWAVARSFRLSPADASDVAQATWLRLVEHMQDIRDAERLGAWLATTARREALGLLRRSRRDIPVDGTGLLDTDDAATPTPEQHVLRTEQEVLLWRAFEHLGEGCQRLLRVLMVDPPPSYAEVAVALDLPIGSIGPTRARCLSTLRSLLGT